MNQDNYLEIGEGRGGRDLFGDGILELAGRRYAVRDFSANFRIILAEMC